MKQCRPGKEGPVSLVACPPALPAQIQTCPACCSCLFMSLLYNVSRDAAAFLPIAGSCAF